MANRRHRRPRRQRELETSKKTASISGDLGKQLGTLNTLYVARLKGINNQPAPRFEIALSIYNAADKCLPRTASPPTAPAFSSIALTLGKASDDAGKVTAGIDKVAALVTPEDRLLKTAATGHFALEVALRADRYFAISSALASAPASPEAWSDFVASRSTGKFKRPDVPLVAADPVFPARFDPDVAGAIADDIAQNPRRPPKNPTPPRPSNVTPSPPPSPRSSPPSNPISAATRLLAQLQRTDS